MVSRVVLITPTPPDISAFGIRALSAYLQREEIPVRTIFLPGGIEKLAHGKSVEYSYSEKILNEIVQLCDEAGIIGISFLSQYRDRAIQLTETLRKRTTACIVWGGIHAQTDPEDALRYADAVCIGEGEDILVELSRRIDAGNPIGGIPGLWIQSNEHADASLPRSLIQDLDELPPVDFDCIDHHVLNPFDDRIMRLDEQALEHLFPLMPAPGNKPVKVYRTMTSRGCPHRCTYCANRVQAQRHTGEKYLRFRSPDHVLNELKQVKARYPFIQAIHFFDDVFTAMPRADLETLCSRYKTEIGLPFYAQISPMVMDRPMMELLIDSGLVFLDMGIQTGSETTRAMYQRPETNGQILDAARLIYEFKDQLITPHYHVILDNPWESRKDLQQTLNLLLQIPGRYKLCLSSLTFFPGTELYDRACSEHRIEDETRDIYQKPFYIPKGRYFNYLIYLTDIHWIPRSVLRWLGGFPAAIFDRSGWGPVFGFAWRLTEMLRLIGKGVHAGLQGDFHRIIRYFKRVK